jgi:poly(3-hydroxybutyrate) depolymerase
MRLEFVAPDCGHYGIFSGRRWREMIYPKVAEFIKDHA